MSSFLATSMNVLKVCTLCVCKSVLRGANYRKLPEKSLVVLLSSLLVGHLPAAYASDNRYADYQLKAAFILNFPNFITWPKSSDDEKSIICTFSDDAVADSIEMLLASPQMAERNARIRFFRNPDIDMHCDLAFVGVKAKNRIAEIISPRQSSHTLIVSDIPNYAVSGGMIELALVDARIQVILNREVMNSRGFIVDSRLLQLTTDVSTSGPQVGK